MTESEWLEVYKLLRIITSWRLIVHWGIKCFVSVLEPLFGAKNQGLNKCVAVSMIVGMLTVPTLWSLILPAQCLRNSFKGIVANGAKCGTGCSAVISVSWLWYYWVKYRESHNFLKSFSVVLSFFFLCVLYHLQYLPLIKKN